MIRKMLQVFVVAVVLFVLFGSVSAADNHWLGTAGDNEWFNAANWEDGHVPDAVLWPEEEAEIGYTTVGAGPILGEGDVGSAYRIFLGQNDGESMYGELTMDGGTLTTSSYMSTAYHEGTSALITMNSGSVYIGDPNGSNGHLYLGRSGSAIFNLNGGTFIIDDSLQLGRNATGYGEINLAGGILQVSTLKLGDGTGLIDITGGTLILNGDDTAVVDDFIASGMIIGYAGMGTLNVAYENELTTVTASDDTSFAWTNVDNFESYTDLEGNRIYEFWIDGYTNNSGSVVGNVDAPFAERNIVHSGRQSMPMLYNNAESPWYSEAERTWDTPQDWTADAPEALRLYVRSDPNNEPAQLYVAVQDNDGLIKVATHPDVEAVVGLDKWQEWMIPLSEFTEAGLNMTQIKTMYIGVGDRDSPTAGSVGSIYVDDIALVSAASAAGYALDFDGIDDYVETPLSDVPMDGTVEAWVNTTVSDLRQAVFSSYGNDQEFRLHLNYQPGKGGGTPGVLGLNVRFRTLTAYVDIGSEMYNGSWHHVAFVWEGGSPGTIRAYWDGQEKAVTYRDQGDWEGNYARTSVHVIGREDLNNSKYFFTGMIDEVRFWGERARTQTEIQEYMSKGLTGDEEGLIGYWKFNESEGTKAYDSSLNGNDGTISGATWTSDMPPVAP